MCHARPPKVNAAMVPLEDVNKSMPLIDVELEKVRSGTVEVVGNEYLAVLALAASLLHAYLIPRRLLKLARRRSMFELKSFE